MTAELRSSKKGLINIKNNDQKCFLWSHVSHIIPVKIHPERITQSDKELINDLDYDGIKFPVDKEDFSKIPIRMSDQKFENSMDLLLAIDGSKPHYVYIKDFDRFMFHKTNNKNKTYFCESCLQCFSSRKILTEHKEFV